MNDDSKTVSRYLVFLPILVNIVLVVFFYGRQTATTEQLAVSIVELRANARQHEERIRAVEIDLAKKGGVK